MNTNVVQIAVFTLVFACSTSMSPALAETPEKTLPQLIEHSLLHNGDLKSFREEKGVREAGKAKAGVLPNPMIEFDGSAGALTGSKDENSLSLAVSQEFLLAGKRAKRLASADRELEIYRWQLAERERILREEIKTVFYAVLLAEQRVALSERSILLNRQLLDVAKERLAAGDIPELELNLVKVELARSEGTRISMSRELYQSMVKLQGLTGYHLFKSLAITGSLGSGYQLNMNLDGLKQLARSRRPDIKIVESEKAKGDADIVLAEAEGIPNLTASLSFRRDATAMEIGGVTGKETAYSLGLKLSIPIPVFDKNQAGIQEARARRNSSESRFSALTMSVEREVETAYDAFRNAESVLELYRNTILSQLEENLKLTQEAYRLGEVGILSVVQEQKKFFEINESYIAAQHDLQTAFVKLESAVATELNGGVQ